MCTSKLLSTLIALVVMAMSLPAYADSHPFLLVTDDMYDELRARAANEPWDEMKSTALEHVGSATYDPAAGATAKHHAIRRIAGAGALAYIVDPANKTAHKNKVRDVLLRWDDARQAIVSELGDWGAAVPPGASFFISVIAYDIIYPDLSASERTTIEAMFERMAGYLPSTLYWAENIYATVGLWALFKGDMPTFETNLEHYRHDWLEKALTPNGVNVAGPGYAWGRATASARSPSKSHFMDVVEFQGREMFYGNETIQGHYEWLMAGALTPHRSLVSFADTAHTAFYYTLRNSARLRSLHRFSERAAGYAAWQMETRGQRPHLDDLLLAYILMDQPMAAPLKPTSTLWRDGGAAFWEDDPSDLSLMGAMWNASKQEWHSHKDTNALHITAFGENLLINAGYNGAWVGIPGTPFDWDWINHQTFSNNTVIVGGRDHVAKVGAGLSEGLLSPWLDYASGDSGAALGPGHHQRNFVFVHPQDDRPGYFLVYDEVQADDPADHFEVLWHPDSADFIVVTPGEQYRWTIQRFGEQDVFLDIYTATRPSPTTILDGGLASWEHSFVGKYIRGQYATDAQGKGQAVTVFFPSISETIRPSFAQIAEAHITGARIDHGDDVVDLALESRADGPVEYDGLVFEGRALLARSVQAQNALYFVRQGRLFEHGSMGFTSDEPITISVRENEGRIISPGTDVTFFHPGIEGLFIGGTTAPVLESGPDRVRVHVPEGTHEIAFSFEPPDEDEGDDTGSTADPRFPHDAGQVDSPDTPTAEPSPGDVGHAGPGSDGGYEPSLDAAGDGGGCACTSSRSTSPPALPGFLIIAALLIRRRKRCALRKRHDTPGQTGCGFGWL
ncbi:MAG: heparinase II/III family protein [Bradymonadaceae bacterium]